MTIIDAPQKSWTIADLLAMPDDGVERYIIDGELFELRDEADDRGMTLRNYPHSRTMNLASWVLRDWLKRCSTVGGDIVTGDTHFLLARDPQVSVGADLAFISEPMRIAVSPDAAFFEGPPVLALEIVSPSDTIRSINDKVRAYLKYGARMVWVLDPDPRIVTVHRPDVLPAAFNMAGRLENFDELPGFACSVADLF